MTASSARQLKRRVKRLVQPRVPTREQKWPAYFRHLLLALAGIGSLAACSQLRSFETQTDVLPGSDTSTAGTMKAMDGELGTETVEKKMRQVKNAADSEDLVAIEIVFFEMEGEHAEAPETAILTPADRKAYIDALSTRRETTQVSYPRVLTKNRRAVTIRSVINEPYTYEDPDTKEESLGYMPIGTIVVVGPVILETGKIHCDINLTNSKLIGERVKDGRRYPIASSHVFGAPLVIDSGHTFRLSRMGPVSQGKHLIMLVTPTRIPKDQAPNFVE